MVFVTCCAVRLPDISICRYRVTVRQVDPEQRDQDPVAMKFLQDPDINAQPIAHAEAVAPLSFANELFRSQEIDLAERISKR